MHLDPDPAPIVSAANCGCSDCWSMCEEPGFVLSFSDGTYSFDGFVRESESYTTTDEGRTISVRLEYRPDDPEYYEWYVLSVDGHDIAEWPNAIGEPYRVLDPAWTVSAFAYSSTVPRPDWDGRVELYGGCCCNHHVYCVGGHEIHVSVEIWPGTTGGILYSSIRIWCANDHRVGEQGCEYGEPILLWYGRKYWSETEPNTNHIGTYEKYAGCIDLDQWVLE